MEINLNFGKDPKSYQNKFKILPLKNTYSITQSFTLKSPSFFKNKKNEDSPLQINDFSLKTSNNHPQITLKPVNKMKIISLKSFSKKSNFESKFSSPSTQIMEIQEEDVKKTQEFQKSEILLYNLIETIFSMKDILMSDYFLLEEKHKLIVSFFLKKKFQIELKNFFNKKILFIPKQNKKTKRNEEIYKYGLKTFFKLYGARTNKIDFQNKVTGIKQKFMKKILKEISDFLKINFHDFLNKTFISKNDLMIKGIKRVNLYNKSITFKKDIEFFYRNEFINHSKKIRKEKIKNLCRNLISKIEWISDLEECEKILKIIFENKRFKLPWTENELNNTKKFGIKYFCC